MTEEQKPLTEEELKAKDDEIHRKSKEGQLRHEIIFDMVERMPHEKRWELEQKLKGAKDENLREIRESLERSRRHSRIKLRHM